MTRLFDILLAFLGICFLLPIGFILYLVGIYDTGSPIFTQERLGKDMKPFVLIKFRTMHLDTKSVATHLANSSSVTKLGAFLRKSKLDELPQLINVLKGEMSFVGPRPNLSNQKELINERLGLGVYSVRPGITGLAQINNIDMSNPKLLAQKDYEMLKTMSIPKYFYYIISTILGGGSGDNIDHDK